jgi:exonuclease SbcD
MRILHTADWHLCDRLGRIDRTDDLRRAVEQVAGYCDEENVDVLLVAGDLFSELARPEGLRDAISHLQDTFLGFLRRGGTILTLTGNHDSENFCQTLRHAMSLAAPVSGKFGDLAQPGRLYLATEPQLLRLADAATGRPVQFVLMPYPTPTRYLKDAESQKYQGLDEKNRNLMAAYTATLNEIMARPEFDTSLQSVLAAHVAVRGSELPTLFRLSEQEDVVFSDADLPTGFAYIALGHIHKPQALMGQSHIRYCGSIERLDLGEKDDSKGIVVFDVGPEGRQGEPRFLPLEATAVYEVRMSSPTNDLPLLRQMYPNAKRDLVRIEFTYTAGVDNLEETLRELDDVFPRYYHRNWTESGALGPSLTLGEAPHSKSFEETVRDYLKHELGDQPEDVAAAVLARAEALMREVQA